MISIDLMKSSTEVRKAGERSNYQVVYLPPWLCGDSDWGPRPGFEKVGFGFWF